MSDIELVIKIPEEIYKASQIIDAKYEDVIQIPLEVIANGIPLPKGHGRLIEDKFITITDIREDGSEFTYVPYEVIEDALTILEGGRIWKQKHLMIMRKLVFFVMR